MRKFNIRKVLDGLTAGSSSSAAASAAQQQQQPPHLAHPPGAREPDVPETLQAEHFQLCKVGAGRALAPRPAGDLEGLGGVSAGSGSRPDGVLVNWGT